MSGDELAVALAAWAAYSVFAAMIAANKGRSFLRYLACGLLLSPLITFLAAVIVSDKHASSSESDALDTQLEIPRLA
jgi:hypothetical protein